MINRTNQTLCSKSEQKFSVMTKPQLSNLQQTVANTILIININNSNNFNSLVSQSVESVSELVTKVDNDQTQVN